MNNIIVSALVGGVVSLVISLIMNHISINGNLSYNRLPALMSHKITEIKKCKLENYKYKDGMFFYKIERNKQDVKERLTIDPVKKPINIDDISNEGIVLEFQDIKTDSMMLKLFSMGDMILNLSNSEHVDANINDDNRIVIFLNEYSFPIEIKGEILGKAFIYSVKNESSSNKAKIVKS